MKQNKYVEVMYELYVPNETGNWDIVEKTSKEHPLKFVTGMDFALEAFENDGDFRLNLYKDSEITSRLSNEEIENIFDKQAFLKHIDDIYKKVLG